MWQKNNFEKRIKTISSPSIINLYKKFYFKKNQINLLKISKALFYCLVVLIIVDIIEYISSESISQFTTEILLEEEFLDNEIKAIELIKYIISKPSFWSQLEKEQGISNEVLNQNDLRERIRFKFISELKLNIESDLDDDNIELQNKAVSIIIRRVNDFQNSKVLKESFNQNEKIKIQKTKLEHIDSIYISLVKDSYHSSKAIYNFKLDDLKKKKVQTISELTSAEISKANSELNLNSFNTFIHSHKEIKPPHEANLYNKIFFHISLLASLHFTWIFLKKLKN
jgi:hypothetical protein